MEYNAKATTPASPTQAGYVFGGWYSNEGLTDAYNFATPVTTNVKLYAKWTPLFRVNFDLKGGAPVVDPKTVVEGSLVATPAEPVREGYVFGGWYSDEGLTTVYDFATPVTDNMTLYVKWKALFTIKFVAGVDSTPSLPKIVIEGDVTHAPDPSELPPYPGNIIYGWTKDFTTKIPYDFQTPVTGNFSLYAMWSQIYTVNFETNGGSAVETQILGSKNYVKVPEPPTKPGFIFEGWYRNSGLTVPYDFEQFVINGNLTRTIYAKWTEL